MTNHPNRKLRYKVHHAPGMSDDAGIGYFAVLGPRVDEFAVCNELARVMQRACNAGPQRLTEREQDAIFAALAFVECGEDPWDGDGTMRSVKSAMKKLEQN